MTKFRDMTPRQQQWVKARKQARKEANRIEEKHNLNRAQALIAGYLVTDTNRLECRVKII